MRDNAKALNTLCVTNARRSLLFRLLIRPCCEWPIKNSLKFFPYIASYFEQLNVFSHTFGFIRENQPTAFPTKRSEVDESEHSKMVGNSRKYFDKQSKFWTRNEKEKSNRMKTASIIFS